ncbi:hypothetical protein [Halobacillus salinus]|uniref:Uncharacterized protein n=1 Tax=Halobacillus salinus TaxID=192814 RepID=A0A4Z0GZK9_9BACI|nr:hypothetical protein [Halobacillus salinus]TGB03662.1 hypothetical protein E4663_01265 [Halobacillus salinus]
MKMVCSDITSLTNWKRVFEYAIDHSTSFSIVFPEGEPDDENPLLTGKSDFLRLEEVTVNTWDGMADSIIVSGRLCNEALNTFRKYMTPSFSNEGALLWHFDLFNEMNPVMSISDFHVCILHLDQQALDVMKQENLSLETFDFM